MSYNCLCQKTRGERTEELRKQLVLAALMHVKEPGKPAGSKEAKLAVELAALLEPYVLDGASSFSSSATSASSSAIAMPSE
jgi:hypothetical protein